MTQINQIPNGYKANAKGHLIPVENIREIDLLRDEEVRSMITAAKEQQDALRIFRNSIFDTIASFVELSYERYGIKRGGTKGNIMLTSFDGQYKVTFAVAERLTFDEGLQAARVLIDKCISEWSEGANHNLKVIVDRAFDTDKEGNLSTTRILSLRKTQIDDARWDRAMDAISESIQVSDTSQYVRFYEKDAKGKYRAISLNIADL